VINQRNYIIKIVKNKNLSYANIQDSVVFVHGRTTGCGFAMDERERA
jgi:hypothetical protein